MTTQAGDLDVLACQFEGGQVMVKGGRQPAAGGVAGAATRAVLPMVSIIRRMAGKAVGGCALEDAVDMTTQAGNLNVFSCQFKGGQIVVVGGRFPCAGGVAGTAVRSVLTIVSIITRVAGKAVCGCAFEDAVDMTTQAGNLNVFSCQFEGGQVVVVGCRFPTAG